MGDEADVRAVDAHAEGVRGDDDGVGGGDEGVVDARALGVGHAAVVEEHPRVAETASGGGEAREDAFRVLARGDVDDAGAVGTDERGDALELRLMGMGGDDGEVEVVAAEALHLHVGLLARGLAEAQLADDVRAHVGRRRGGDGEDGDVGEAGERVADIKVIGTEVVSPLADAVGLVDGEKGEFGAGDGLQETRAAKALGGDVDELVLAEHHRVEAGGHLGGGEGRVEAGCGDVAPFERGHLVRHQRDERRDDERRAGEHERRKLVAEGLAGTGGHHDDGVAPGEDLGDGLILAVPEVVVAEMAPERRVNVLFRYHARTF